MTLITELIYLGYIWHTRKSSSHCVTCIQYIFFMTILNAVFCKSMLKIMYIFASLINVMKDFLRAVYTYFVHVILIIYSTYTVRLNSSNLFIQSSGSY